MKRIALFMLLFFGPVQVVPGLQSVFGEGKGLIFNIDEEKISEKAGPDDLKEKKGCPSGFSPSPLSDQLYTIAFQWAVHILPAPCPDQQTPPPNFC